MACSPGSIPRSSYIDPDSFHEIEVQTRASTANRDRLTMEDGLLKVVAPIDDTQQPEWRHGQRHYH